MLSFQPELILGALAARTSQLTLWYPCRQSACRTPVLLHAYQLPAWCCRDPYLTQLTADGSQVHCLFWWARFFSKQYAVCSIYPRVSHTAPPIPAIYCHHEDMSPSWAIMRTVSLLHHTRMRCLALDQVLLHCRLSPSPLALFPA